MEQLQIRVDIVRHIEPVRQAELQIVATLHLAASSTLLDRNLETVSVSEIDEVKQLIRKRARTGIEPIIEDMQKAAMQYVELRPLLQKLKMYQNGHDLYL